MGMVCGEESPPVNHRLWLSESHRYSFTRFLATESTEGHGIYLFSGKTHKQCILAEVDWGLPQRCDSRSSTKQSWGKPQPTVAHQGSG
jgi:hypothetical protein